MEKLRDAIKYCARCVDVPYPDETARIISCVRVTDQEVYGTDGRVCLKIPVAPTGVTDPLYLTDTEATLVEHGTPSPSVKSVPQLGPRPIGKYPDTEAMANKVRQVDPKLTILVDPKYLAKIGQVFQEMGFPQVRLVLRGEVDPMEIIGEYEEENRNVVAFIAPRRPTP